MLCKKLTFTQYSFSRAISAIEDKDLKCGDKNTINTEFYADMEKRLLGFLEKEKIQRVDIEDYLAKGEVCRSV